jgi:hypothetical protein
MRPASAVNTCWRNLKSGGWVSISVYLRSSAAEAFSCSPRFHVSVVRGLQFCFSLYDGK